VAEKRCHYCGRVFVPEPRVGDRQKACSVACQRLRKKGNNRTFSKSNPGYWCGRYPYVKQWRLKHPDYQRQWRQMRRVEKRRSPGEIQAERLRKAIEFTERIYLCLREIQAEILLRTLAIPAKKAALIF